MVTARRFGVCPKACVHRASAQPCVGAGEDLIELIESVCPIDLFSIIKLWFGSFSLVVAAIPRLFAYGTDLVFCIKLPKTISE